MGTRYVGLMLDQPLRSGHDIFSCFCNKSALNLQNLNEQVWFRT